MITKTGQGLRATSQNPRAAALIGIPVAPHAHGRLGASPRPSPQFAGILLGAEACWMTPDMGAVVMLAFAAAIVGGFTSLSGCVIGGSFSALCRTSSAIMVSPQAISVTPFFVIIAVLLLRPQGLFGEAIASKKVVTMYGNIGKRSLLLIAFVLAVGLRCCRISHLVYFLLHRQWC